MLIFTLTVFLGAFLLLQVELIVGKYILPWFGGTSAVWITCMLFFQAVLLAGYAYGHVLDRAGARRQALLHRILLLVSLLVLIAQFLLWHSPLTLDSSWKPRAQGNPLVQIFVLLAVSVGLPYLVLASTSPLLQTWWRRIYPARSPYRLYAISNFGSFLGLVSYPFLVEPFLTLKTQARLWTWAYAAFALGCGYCALQAARAGELAVDSAGTEGLENRAPSSFPATPRVTGRLVILWLGLAACASAMFLGTTNQLCKNVAAVPLLWVLPLAIYLLTFALCFESDHGYSRKWFHPAFALAVFLACFVLSTGARRDLLAQVGVYYFVLFAGCMICHGELARLKPDPRRLTLFYLIVAAGGALGGLFVALLAPILFVGYWEYQVSLWFAVLLFLITLFRDRSSWLRSTRVKGPLVLLGAAALLPESMALAVDFKTFLRNLPFLAAIAVAILLVQSRQKPASDRTRKIAALASCGVVLVVLGTGLVTLGTASLGNVTSVRNFYAALAVDRQDESDPGWEAYALRNGEIVHGFEFRTESKQRIPTSYYAEDSGLGLLLSKRSDPAGADPAGQNLRIGAVGLGIGTLAAYGHAGDYIRFYEINPQDARLASDDRYFRYLKDCPAKVDIALGDARLSLERELQQGVRQNFDVLVVDAFSGDAIPVHLLTQEAFEVYLRHLKNPGGVLAVHVTNTFLDLRPVVVAAAEHFGLASVSVHAEQTGHISYTNDWVLVSREQGLIDSIAASAKHAAKLQVSEKRLWTDDYSNIFQALVFKNP